MTTGNINKVSSALRPVVTPILRIQSETPKIKSYTLRAPTIAHIATPGQFLMVWIPGTDEIPMSISKASGTQVEFAAAKVGDATSTLHQMNVGDLLGLRGPLGQGYAFPAKPKTKALLLVAGGCGSPPIRFAAIEAQKKGFLLDIVLGASTKEELLFHEAFNALKPRKLIIATDDGTAGIKGTSVNACTTLLNTNSQYAACFACGPEAMLVSLLQLVKNHSIPLQLSLERYMKCGVGICGHCIIDNQGRRVCQEGPVFDARTLDNTDFGRWTRDSTGKRQPASKTEICSS